MLGKEVTAKMPWHPVRIDGSRRNSFHPHFCVQSMSRGSLCSNTNSLPYTLNKKHHVPSPKILVQWYNRQSLPTFIALYTLSFPILCSPVTKSWMRVRSFRLPNPKPWIYTKLSIHTNHNINNHVYTSHIQRKASNRAISCPKGTNMVWE